MRKKITAIIFILFLFSIFIVGCNNNGRIVDNGQSHDSNNISNNNTRSAEDMNNTINKLFDDSKDITPPDMG